MIGRRGAIMAACAMVLMGCGEPGSSEPEAAEEAPTAGVVAESPSTLLTEQWWCPGDGGYDHGVLVSARVTNVTAIREWQAQVGGGPQDFLAEHSGDQGAAVCMYEADSFDCPGGPAPLDGSSRQPYTHASTIVVGEDTYPYQCIRGMPTDDAYGPASATPLHEPTPWPP